MASLEMIDGSIQHLIKTTDELTSAVYNLIDSQTKDKDVEKEDSKKIGMTQKILDTERSLCQDVRGVQVVEANIWKSQDDIKKQNEKIIEQNDRMIQLQYISNKIQLMQAMALIKGTPITDLPKDIEIINEQNESLLFPAEDKKVKSR